MPTPENEDVPTVAIRPSSVNPSAMFDGLPEVEGVSPIGSNADLEMLRAAFANLDVENPDRDDLNTEANYIERAWARFEAVSARLANTVEGTPERHAAEARMLILADEFLERFPPEEDLGFAGFWNEEEDGEKKPDTLRSAT